jgi:hypothetical protein
MAYWTLIFDIDRAGTHMKLPLDYPRINQFPQWFVVSDDKTYRVSFAGDKHSVNRQGRQLKQGFPVKIQGGRPYHLVLEGL